MDTNLQWCAGFFEGDGSMSLRNGSRIGLHVSQSYIEPLEALKKQFGGRINYIDSQGIFRWALNTRSDVRDAIDTMAPYLIRKRDGLDKYGVIYDKRVATDFNIDWVAGFYEADGTFSTTRIKTYTYPVANISQNRRDNLSRAAEIVGFGKVYGPYGKSNKCTYVVRNKKAEEFLEMIYDKISPHRQEQYKNVLQKTQEVI